MAIYFSSENTNFDLIAKLKVKKWISNTIKSQGKKVGDISYIFCDDDYLIDINREYLNHDTYTDIITFDYVEGEIVSGDIFISVERVEENAKLFATTFDQELHRVIIHGIHHLLGQHDKTDADAAVMRSKEDVSLAEWNSMN